MCAANFFKFLLSAVATINQQMTSAPLKVTESVDKTCFATFNVVQCTFICRKKILGHQLSSFIDVILY